MKYYTSDLHLNHAKIITLCDRPFKDVKEMNETIINNWNTRVKKGDIVYILGDVGLPKSKQDVIEVCDMLETLNGEKILVTGNHDKELLKHSRFHACFSKVVPYAETKDNGKKVCMFHYPIEEWNGYYKDSIHLYGHVHNSDVGLKDIKNRYNVGVDVNDFEPKTLEELINK
jgi:calcineurin-like phosphoesterase family protein